MKKRLVFVIISLLLVYSGVLLAQNGEESSSAFYESTVKTRISAVMDFTYIQRLTDDDQLKNADIPGFVDSSKMQQLGFPERGFDLNYGEFAVDAGIVPYFNFFFDMKLLTSVADDNTVEFGAEVEELYVKTIAIPYGFSFKMGRFLSSFGGSNVDHAHSWDFYERPLAYNALFGNRGLLENGIQLAWRLPVSFIITLGLEALEGDNEVSFGAEKIANADVDGTKYPNLFVGFLESDLKLGNVDFSWGISIAYGKVRIDNGGITAASGTAMDGTSILFGADLHLKYHYDSFRYLGIQSEFIYRTMSGTKYYSNGASILNTEYERGQGGFYLKLVARPFVYWRLGLRVGGVFGGETIGTTTVDAPGSLLRPSAMIDCLPTDFSRIRLQYNYDMTRYEDIGAAPAVSYSGKTTHEIILQFTMAVGEHGDNSR
ncbi:MAG: hypothetical protein GY754_18290 [bacterium]|nr:hypothetical protein [bacterium]